MSYKRALVNLLLPIFLVGCASVNSTHQYTLPEKISLITTCDEARKNLTTAQRNYSKFSEAYSEIYPKIENFESAIIEAKQKKSRTEEELIKAMTSVEERKINWKSLDYFFVTQVELYKLSVEELCKE